MAFRPDEVLFAPTGRCNLSCAHCDVPRSRKTLSTQAAERFLRGCKRVGIRRVGFTGGEPFLAPTFLIRTIAAAVREGLSFDRIMTNGVWWKSSRQLVRTLSRVAAAGYDGDICVSVDAFHRQDLRAVASFVETSVALWRRPDIVSVAYVVGAAEDRTRAALRKLAGLLGARLCGFGTGHCSIKSGTIFVRLLRIRLSPVGRAERLKNGWDGTWFKDDYCAGPGNALFVLPDGNVKPCCGYATGSDRLTIGAIPHDSAARIVRKSRDNSFVSTVFDAGLGRIRRRLEAAGYIFPGKTTDHCFLCDYLLTNVPGVLLDKCLDK
jgi:uncharacterized Fe-S cluster-containing radical SAM superfamily protein